MIVLAGVIGAGKSSLAQALGQHLGTEVFYEPVEGNPVLDMYYQNPKQYAFLLQIYFLNKRFASIKQALRADHNILDRSIFEDELFLTLNYEQGHVTKVELAIYKELLANMLEALAGLPKKQPDLLIYIDVSLETMLDRIKRRGRDFEQFDQSPELKTYYSRVHTAYQGWYQDYTASPKLRIDGDELDFVQDELALKQVLAQIDQALDRLRTDHV